MHVTQLIDTINNKMVKNMFRSAPQQSKLRSSSNRSPYVLTLGPKITNSAYKIQGSHKLWKLWKTWKITQKSSLHGKILEFEKNRIIMEKTWNFVKYYVKTTSCKKTSCRTHKCPTASFLATGGCQV